MCSLKGQLDELIIESERFMLKELNEAHATKKYLDWFRDEQVEKYIQYKTNSDDLENLKKYIVDKKSNNNCLFLGIFSKKNMEHIGNIKYEPIDFDNSSATMGILIGEKKWRGKGVSSEIITTTSRKLNLLYGINTIYLGVEKDNQAAVQSYIKSGFKVIAEDYDVNVFRMRLKL